MGTVQRRASGPRDPARRRRVLDAAKQHFTRYGFKGTRLEAVAEEAGCAKGAVYLEFPDKEALLREVIDEVFRAVRARFDAEVVGLASPLARLVATLRFAYKMLEVEPIFARLLRDDPELAVLRPPPEVAAQMPAVRAQVDELAAWVDEGVACGEIRADIDRDAVPFVIGLLRHVPTQLPMTAGLIAGERVLAALLDIFAAGLAARPGPAAPARHPAARQSKRTNPRRSS
jgi:TetR/AcrR family transcriptional regulator, cholesterol catabolism regulator